MMSLTSSLQTKKQTKALSKRSDTKINPTKKITHIYLQDRFSCSIEKLPPCEHLTVLYLHNNQITRIENLHAATHLTNLYLQRNRILKIENLQSLKFLKKLYLSHNEISVIEGLESLNNLEELHIEKQNLNGGDSLCFDPRSITAISKSLLVLNISYNNITTILPLISLKYLKTINAGFNKLTNIKEVSETIQNWYYLYEATFMGNPIAKQHRYRENIIANTSRLSVLDNKDINETTRCFIKRFEENLLNRTSTQSINLVDTIPNLPKNYPPSIQKAVSASILKPILRPGFEQNETSLESDGNDIYLAWKALPKSTSNLRKSVPPILQKQRKRNEKQQQFSTTFPHLP